MADNQDGSRAVRALQVRQWLPEWEDVPYNDETPRPPEHFYLFALSASVLRALCGIERRRATKGARRAEDPGIQRGHDQERSEEISRFVRFGFPFSSLSDARRKSDAFEDLKKPGWLPTAIVVNVRTGDDTLGGSHVDAEDLVRIEDHEDGTATVHLPAFDDAARWSASGLDPLEVIDGQHRLWAFDPGEDEDEFELPVVAFDGLARTWQAYLFWTINIKPKKINASLAYDLYPLLRDEKWLERFEGPSVYRETRAQELTELLWTHDDSPWQGRINMLGESGLKFVSQAAWVRSLTSTYIKSWEGRGVRGIGGLFGAPVGEDNLVLPWSREQQAAFLILVWIHVEVAVKASDDQWAEDLRRIRKNEGVEPKAEDPGRDAAFAGRYSLLNSDQGVRGILSATNDLIYVDADNLGLEDWRPGAVSERSDVDAVSDHLATLRDQPVSETLERIARSLASFDWRTSATPGLGEEQRLRQAVYRGGSGYRELRRQLLTHLEATSRGRVKSLAREAQELLGLDESSGEA